MVAETPVGKGLSLCHIDELADYPLGEIHGLSTRKNIGVGQAWS